MGSSHLATSILKSIVDPRGRLPSRCDPHGGRDGGHRRKRSLGADMALAVRQRDLDTLEKLVREQDADPNVGLGTFTPLTLALTLGALPCVEALLRLGADPRRRSQDEHGRLEPPLVTAVRLGCPPCICSLLIDCGAHPDDPDFYGHSPLWVAVYGKRGQHVQLLIDKGAKVTCWSPEGERLSLPWCENPLYEAVRQGWRWCTPLVSAGASGTGVLLDLAVQRGDPASAKGLVLAAGIRLPPTDCAPDALLGWLLREMSTPPPLARLCRHRVRDCLSRAAQGRDFKRRARLLPLPEPLVRYVLLDPLGP